MPEQGEFDRFLGLSRNAGSKDLWTTFSRAGAPCRLRVQHFSFLHLIYSIRRVFIEQEILAQPRMIISSGCSAPEKVGEYCFWKLEGYRAINGGSVIFIGPENQKKESFVLIEREFVNLFNNWELLKQSEAQQVEYHTENPTHMGFGSGPFMPML